MTDRSVPITLDRLRHLRYRFNDLADMHGVNPNFSREGWGGISGMRLFLWAGLRWEDPKLRQYPAGAVRAGELIDQYLENGGTLADIAEKIGQAVDASVFVEAANRQRERATISSEEPEDGEPKN